MSKKDDEVVLCLPRSVLEVYGPWVGLRSVLDFPEFSLAHMLHPSLCHFVRRGDCEQDPSFKQVIPYIVLTHYLECDDKQVFCYTRGTSGGEERLAQKRSLGVGGHVQFQQGLTPEECFWACANRELGEEVKIDGTVPPLVVTGLINLDESEVQKVHVGVILQAQLTHDRVTSNEPEELLETGFVSIAGLYDLQRQNPAKMSTFEDWSRVILKSSVLL